MPVLNKHLKQNAAALYSRPPGEVAKIVPKEFFQKVDSALREESLKKIESLRVKSQRKQSMTAADECGV